MYQKYTTYGFLVATRPSKEADMSYVLYTDDFGLIVAHATSARLAKSKLRPHLVMGVRLAVTLLRAKAGWKLVEAKQVSKPLVYSTEAFCVFAKILATLKSLVHGEEKNESLSLLLDTLHHTLMVEDGRVVSQGIEMLALIKLLSVLGYGLPGEIGHLAHADFGPVAYSELISQKEFVIKSINNSLRATGF